MAHCKMSKLHKMENYGLGDKSNSNESEREKVREFCTDQYAYQKIKGHYIKWYLYIGLQNKQAYWNLLIILLCF
jgi:hypothetical protein